MLKLNQMFAPGAVLAVFATALMVCGAAQADPRVSIRAPIARPAVPVLLERPSNISAREAKYLRHKSQDLKHMKRLAAADGEVTRTEQKRISYYTQKLRAAFNRAKSN